jgi:hypothetical protein
LSGFAHDEDPAHPPCRISTADLNAMLGEDLELCASVPNAEAFSYENSKVIFWIISTFPASQVC